MAINSDVKIEINLSELVAIRASFLGEQLSEDELEGIANELRLTLTWDTLYYMVDQTILDHLDKADNHYGEIANDAWLNEIEKNKKQFELVKLTSPSWEIEVPMRKDRNKK